MLELSELLAIGMVAAHENLAGLSRAVFYDCGVLDVLDIGGEGMKVLRGLIQHGQDAFEGPIRSCLRRARPKRGSDAAHTNYGEN